MASTNGRINALVEAALANVGAADNAPVEVDGERALTAHIENTGWLLILAQP